MLRIPDELLSSGPNTRLRCVRVAWPVHRFLEARWRPDCSPVRQAVAPCVPAVTVCISNAPGRPNQLLVVAPSRELALQIGAVIEQLWPWHGTRRVYVLSGSVSAEAQQI